MEIESDFPPATPEAIAAFEARIGGSIPQDLREFLLRYNGGSPEPDVILISASEGSTDIRSLYGLNGDRYDDLAANAESYRRRLPPGLLPIGCDSGDNQFCIAIAGNERGAVYFWDHEREADAGEPPGYGNLTRVARSFDEFLASLTAD